MEHVRLDDLAHREIRRVLKPGGFYRLHGPALPRPRDAVVRVRIVDPDDPAKDVDVLPREYHGDANSEDGRALAVPLASGRTSTTRSGASGSTSRTRRRTSRSSAS
jgi:hypothetical protein